MFDARVNYRRKFNVDRRNCKVPKIESPFRPYKLPSRRSFERIRYTVNGKPFSFIEVAVAKARFLRRELVLIRARVDSVSRPFEVSTRTSDPSGQFKQERCTVLREHPVDGSRLKSVRPNRGLAKRLIFLLFFFSPVKTSRVVARRNVAGSRAGVK